MSDYNIRQKYYNWLCNIVEASFNNRHSYLKLMEYLHSREFIYLIELDENRLNDGLNLRYHFGNVFGFDRQTINHCFNTFPCSILEMLVAMAIKCEEIMNDPEKDDQTSTWFWIMIYNLGLGSEFDEKFNIENVEYRIDIFLNREYEPDGTGSIFSIKDQNKDMRRIELWYQMMYYLSEYMKGDYL